MLHIDVDKVRQLDAEIILLYSVKISIGNFPILGKNTIDSLPLSFINKV